MTGILVDYPREMSEREVREMRELENKGERRERAGGISIRVSWVHITAACGHGQWYRPYYCR